MKRLLCAYREYLWRWIYHQFQSVYSHLYSNKVVELICVQIAKLILQGVDILSRQSVTLIGPNGNGFSNALWNVIPIQEALSWHFKDGKLKKWEPTCVFNELVIHISNQYFQHKGETLPGDVIPLDKNVDPNHILATAAGIKYLHTVNNLMQYYECLSCNDGSKWYPSLELFDD